MIQQLVYCAPHSRPVIRQCPMVALEITRLCVNLGAKWQRSRMVLPNLHTNTHQHRGFQKPRKHGGCRSVISRHSFTGADPYFTVGLTVPHNVALHTFTMVRSCRCRSGLVYRQPRSFENDSRRATRPGPAKTDNCILSRQVKKISDAQKIAYTEQCGQEEAARNRESVR